MVTSFRPSSFWLGSLFVFVTTATVAVGQTTTEIKEVDGYLQRVTRQVIQKPVSKTEWDEQQQTVYREQYDTQWQTNYRTVATPITEYRQELYLANRWNPFGTPYWTYRYVPVTRWETRQEPYQVPVAQRTLVPHQQIVRIPRTTTQMVTDEHTSRVVIGPATTRSNGDPFASPSTGVASKPSVVEKK